MSKLEEGNVVRDLTLVFPDDSPYLLIDINPNGNCIIERMEPLDSIRLQNVVNVTKLELYS